MIIYGYKLVDEYERWALLQNYESGEYYLVYGQHGDREVLWQGHTTLAVATGKLDEYSARGTDYD